MKKTFVTLATVAALVAAAAPVATTLANNNTYNVESQKANAIVAELGREYALAYADAAAAKTNSENAAANLLAAQNNQAAVAVAGQNAIIAVQAELDAANGRLAEAQEKWNIASSTAVSYERADETEAMTPTQAATDEAYAGYQSALDNAKSEVARLKTKLADTEAKVAADNDAAAKIVADAQKEFDAAQVVLAEAVAAKEAAYNKAIGAGATAEQMAAAEAGAAVPAAPAGNGAAANNGGAAAPAGNGAAANNGKAAAKTVAAAKTETGAKTLPKTSAAK